jgi:putative salt-induced outer membrane protein YdiY
VRAAEERLELVEMRIALEERHERNDTRGQTNCMQEVPMLRNFALLALLAVPAFGQGSPPPPDFWSSSVGAGLAITSGNSDTTNINISASTVWDPKTNRTFKADALYLRGDSNGEKTVDKTAANARYEQLFSPRAFWFGEVQLLRDPFKAINVLVSPLAGAGLHLIKTDARTLTVDGAVGAVVEDNDISGRDTSGAVKAGQSFEWAISPTSKVTQKLTGLWKADDFGDALYHFDAGLATTVAARLELKVAYAYDYKAEPPSPEIEKGDSALFAALLLKF